jgi:hypothetical protein
LKIAKKIAQEAMTVETNRLNLSYAVKALARKFPEASAWERSFSEATKSIAAKFIVNYNTLKRNFVKVLKGGDLETETRGGRFLLSGCEEQGLLAWVEWRRRTYKPPSMLELRAKVYTLHCTGRSL